jgi:hypothetical protein
MIAETDLVLTKDRELVVEAGHPDGCPSFPIARKGEQVPEWAQALMRNTSGAKKTPKAANKKAEAASNKEATNG